MTVRYAQRALRDLDEILAYIADENPLAAAGVVTHTKGSLERLDRYPKMGRPTDDERGARVLVIARTNYKAFYDIDADGVLVLRVMHGAQRDS